MVRDVDTICDIPYINSHNYFDIKNEIKKLKLVQSMFFGSNLYIFNL